MHDYPLHAVETDVLLHEGDLLVELARWPERSASLWARRIVFLG